MNTEYTTWNEVCKAIDNLRGNWNEYTYVCHGENIGMPGAVVTGYSIRRLTAEEKREQTNDFLALTEADLNSRTPLFGGRS